MKQDKWTQQLRDKLADYETPAPADLWDDIESALPHPQHMGRLKMLRRLSVAAAIAIALGGGSVVWWSNNHSSTTTESSLSLSPVKQTIFTSDDTQTPSEPQELLAKNNPPKHQVESTHRAHKEIATLSVTNPAYATVDATATSAIHNKADEATEEKRATAEPQPEEFPTQQVERMVTDTKSAPPPSQYSKGKVGHRSMGKKTVAIGLYASNGLNSYDKSAPVYMVPSLLQHYNTNEAASASRQGPIYLSGYEEQHHHRQPIAIGLAVSYPLSIRLSLNSGLVYKQLQSEFTQRIRSLQYTKEQRLYYVGIPFGLSYRLWQHKRLSLYAATSVEADCNIKASSETEGVKQQNEHDRLQWSVNGSIGVQYDVLPYFSLYAEPSVTHYFNNGSSVQNFFKEKPTNLGLQIGIRFRAKKSQQRTF